MYQKIMTLQDPKWQRNGEIVLPMTTRECCHQQTIADCAIFALSNAVILMREGTLGANKNPRGEIDDAWWDSKRLRFLRYFFFVALQRDKLNHSVEGIILEDAFSCPDAPVSGANASPLTVQSTHDSPRKRIAENHSNGQSKRRRVPDFGGHDEFNHEDNDGHDRLDHVDEDEFSLNRRFAEVLEKAVENFAKGTRARTSYSNAARSVKEHRKPLRTLEDALNVPNVGKKIAQLFNNVF